MAEVAYVSLLRIELLQATATLERVHAVQADAEGHLFLLSASELRRLASAAGFSLVVRRTFGNPLSNGHLKTRHLLPFVPRPVVRALEAASQLLPAPLRRAAHAHSASLFRLEARLAD